MKRLILLFAALAFLFGTGTFANAHSTKGRKKVFLEKDVITKDDMAYYIESYVHRKKYKDLYEKSSNRFYVEDFTKVEQKDKTADVFFTVLDVKNNKIFKDSMHFEKNNNGIWTYMYKNKNMGQVYTYISIKDYYAKYTDPFYWTLIALASGIFIFMKIKKYLKKNNRENNWGI